MKTRAFLLGLVLAGAVVGCTGDASDPEPPTVDGPIVVIGVDGMEWNVVLPLIEEGAMPNLRQLMERGAFGKLGTYAPAKSPVIWTTIATGKPPEEHGILDFTRRTPDGRTVLYDAGDRKTKAIWNILSDAERRIAVVGWWNTFPVSEVHGVMVSQANTLEHIAKRRLLKPGGMLRGIPGQVHPPARQAEMLEVVAAVDSEMTQILGSVFGSIARSDDRRQDLDNLNACLWSLRADESNRRLALRLAGETPAPDWMAVYFGTPDVVGHRFWRYHEPEAFEHPPTAAEIERFGDVVEDAYRHVDGVIGELVEALPEDATVFVLSDHGMGAHNVTTDFEVAVDGRIERESGGHEDGPAGLIVAAGPGIRDDLPATPIEELTSAELPIVGQAVDVAPTLLALSEVPIGRDMNGKVLKHLLKPQLAESLNVEFVATHDTVAWIESRRDAKQEAPWTEERIEQLRSLGYID